MTERENEGSLGVFLAGKFGLELRDHKVDSAKGKENFVLVTGGREIERKELYGFLDDYCRTRGIFPDSGKNDDEHSTRYYVDGNDMKRIFVVHTLLPEKLLITTGPVRN